MARGQEPRHGRFEQGSLERMERGRGGRSPQGSLERMNQGSLERRDQDQDQDQDHFELAEQPAQRVQQGSMGRPGDDAPFASVGPLKGVDGQENVIPDTEFYEVGRSVSGWYNFGGLRSVKRLVNSVRFSKPQPSAERAATMSMVDFKSESASSEDIYASTVARKAGMLPPSKPAPIDSRKRWIFRGVLAISSIFVLLLIIGLATRGDDAELDFEGDDLPPPEENFEQLTFEGSAVAGDFTCIKNCRNFLGIFPPATIAGSVAVTGTFSNPTDDDITFDLSDGQVFGPKVVNGVVTFGDVGTLTLSSPVVLAKNSETVVSFTMTSFEALRAVVNLLESAVDDCDVAADFGYYIQAQVFFDGEELGRLVSPLPCI
mmetsp:Transcript_1461/g.2873  ORF Transcript_1461/g.2873 Transcript_1461/m.2873 type:complete len:374 (-) Transcript_1461:140-1261(-)